MKQPDPCQKVIGYAPIAIRRARPSWLGTASIGAAILWLGLVLPWMIGNSGFFERIWPFDLAVPGIGLTLASISLRDEQRRFRETAVVGLVLNGLALIVMAGAFALVWATGPMGPP